MRQIIEIVHCWNAREIYVREPYYFRTTKGCSYFCSIFLFCSGVTNWRNRFTGFWLPYLSVYITAIIKGIFSMIDIGFRCWTVFYTTTSEPEFIFLNFSNQYSILKPTLPSSKTYTFFNWGNTFFISILQMSSTKLIENLSL